MADADLAEKSEEYRQWFSVAVSLVENGDARLENVQSQRLPVNRERLKHCIQLTIQDESKDGQQHVAVREFDAIDWGALWEEYRFGRADSPWLSFTQLAGSISASEQTPRDWDIRTVKDLLVREWEHDADWLAGTALESINVNDKTRYLPSKVAPEVILNDW